MPETPSPASPRPLRERPMHRDGFQVGVYWLLWAFVAVQFVLMAWLDLRG